jgi:hypothetical protein
MCELSTCPYTNKLKYGTLGQYNIVQSQTKEDVLIRDIIWMNLENMLNERSQTQKMSFI